MTEVLVAILHPEAGPAARPLEAAVAEARGALAERHRQGFLEAGAARAIVVAGPPDDVPFGRRLRGILDEVPTGGGLVVLGSGAGPLLTSADRRAFVVAAAAERLGALANNRFSADIVAVARATETLADVPDLPSDNALPRWLAEVREVPLSDRRSSWRLGVDIDGPLDLVLLGARWRRSLPSADIARVMDGLAGVRAVAADARRELVVAGRVSTAGLRWLERHTASRTRALIEERGLRTSLPAQRPAASVLGALLDRDGPASLATHLARLGDAALIDSRVLLAHRCGADASAWPSAEDRFASDLLLHERIRDPWLRDLTASAAEADIPVVLGGHTLVGPGLRLAVGRT